MRRWTAGWLGVLWIIVVLPASAAGGTLALESPDLTPGGRMPEAQVFSGFGCTGGNVSPALTWRGVPEGAKSLALTLYDPDAPTGSGWWHWLIFNIPPDAAGLKRGAGDPKAGTAPPGSVQSMTDFGTVGYGGPCPPPGDPPHRYRFTLYALDIDKVPLDEKASGAMVGFFLNRHQIGKSTLTVRYGR